MATTIQDLTPIGVPLYALNSVVLTTITDVTPYLISRYANMVFGRRESNNKLAYSSDEMATWTEVTSGALTGYVRGVMETYDGELIVSVGGGDQLGPNTLYRSTGWTSNRAGVTFAPVLSVPMANAGIPQDWSFQPANMLPNGTIVINSYGSQVQAGGGAANEQRAKFSYISFNHGATWADFQNLALINPTYTDPANVHWHGSFLHAADNRVYFTFGDNNGQGDDIAGTGNVQIHYYNLDDNSTGFMPLPVGYSGFTAANSLQWTGIGAADDGSIILTPDAKPYGTMVWTRTGYRTYGNLHWTFGNGDAHTIGTGVTHQKAGKPYFVGVGLAGDATLSASYPVIDVSSNGVDWQSLWRDTANMLGTYQYARTTPIGVFDSGKFIAVYKSSVALRLITGTLVAP
jgi:hypothetical protein